MAGLKSTAIKAVSRGDAEAKLAVLAKALAHPARLQIIATLLRRNTCIGCDLVDETGLAASTTSEHLRILKTAGIITGQIERPRVCYSINRAALRPLQAYLNSIVATPKSGTRPTRSS